MPPLPELITWPILKKELFEVVESSNRELAIVQLEKTSYLELDPAWQKYFTGKEWSCPAATRLAQ
jgi:hypothetical protein